MYRPPSIPPPVRPSGSEPSGQQMQQPPPAPGQTRPVRPFPGNFSQSTGWGPMNFPSSVGRPPITGPPPQGMPQRPVGMTPPSFRSPFPGPGPRPAPPNAQPRPVPPNAQPRPAPPNVAQRPMSPVPPPRPGPPVAHPFAPRPFLGAQPPRPPASNGASFPPGPRPAPPHGAFAPQSAPGPRPLAPFPSSMQAPMHQTTAPPPPGPFSSQAARPSSPKIDPAQIPRPTHKESDPPVQFSTRENGQHQVPPLACSNYVCQDTGNCDPKFMRLSLNNIPANNELCTNVAIPLVVFMQPLALQKPEEEPVSVVDFGESGPVRCRRCLAYMNPFMYFQDAGRSFVCPFCNVKNETPADYFCYLATDGKRRDAHDRPELSRGTVEFAAPPAFMVRPPMPPVHFFLIDASYTSVTSGTLHTICSSLKLVIDAIQGQDRALVGIATFDACIHFYHVKNADGSPQVSIVSDITEVFAPLPTLLLSLKDNKDSILEILDLIPRLHENQTGGESCAGAAIEAAVEVLKPTGGKLHAILTSRPTKGNRSLKPREAQIPSSQDKGEREKQMILLPQDNTYRTLGLQAVEFFVSIDMFCLAQNYVDVSTLSVLSNMTGGTVYHYEKFSVQHHSQQFLNDLKWNVSRPQGLEAVLRLRCSPGLEIESYLGSTTARNQHEIELPAIDCEKSIMAKLLYDDKLQEGTEAYLQCALLYTTTSGHRRIRVHTMGVPVTASVNQVFRGADMECYLNFLARRISITVPGNTLQLGKDTVTNGCTNVLAAYRKWCATSGSSSGQLILPDSMKLLPLYTLGLLKSTALRLDARPDERSTFYALLLSLPCSKILNLVYGRFFMLDPILAADQVTVPDTLTLSSEHLCESKLFLYENGQEMLIKVESQVPSETLQALFGFAQVNIKGPEPAVIVSEHPMNIKMQKLLNELRTRAGAYMSLRVALRSTPLEAKFLGCLVDDRNAYGMSYVEHLCTTHRNIQSKLA